jgi:pSer/pThr/pTyr-binding forkhead associated (FHA) protein
MNLKLYFQQGNLSWTLKPNREYIVGSDSGCDIVLPHPNIVAGRHFKLGFDTTSAYWYAQDLDSYRGILINNESVTRTMIRNQVQIQAGGGILLDAYPESVVAPRHALPAISPPPTQRNHTSSPILHEVSPLPTQQEYSFPPDLHTAPSSPIQQNHNHSGEQVIVENFFGTVTNKRVTYFSKKGWLSGKYREDIPLRKVVSVRYSKERSTFKGLFLIVLGFCLLMFGVGIVLLVIGFLMLWGTPAVNVVTAGGTSSPCIGLPWHNRAAEEFVSALRAQLFDE